jgi:hypothetical protein
MRAASSRAAGSSPSCGTTLEEWLRATFEAEGIADPLRLARQILLLLDDSFAVVLLHRDPSYMETAGEAAHALIEAALPLRKKP